LSDINVEAKTRHPFTNWWIARSGAIIAWPVSVNPCGVHELDLGVVD